MGAETCAGSQAPSAAPRGGGSGCKLWEAVQHPKGGFGTLEPAIWQPSPSCLSFPCLGPLHARVPADVTLHVAMMLGQEQLWWCPEEIWGREMFLWHRLLGAHMQPLLTLLLVPAALSLVPAVPGPCCRCLLPPGLALRRWQHQPALCTPATRKETSEQMLQDASGGQGATELLELGRGRPWGAQGGGGWWREEESQVSVV